MRPFMSEMNMRDHTPESGHVATTAGEERKQDQVETIYFTGCAGVRLVGDRRGRVGAPTVLLLHGGGQTRHAWAGAAKRIANAGYCAITLDSRGHGESDWAPDGNYSVDDMADDIRRVVEQVGGSPTIVGASMGGITAMVAVGEGLLPTVNRLVLVDIAPRLERSGVERHQVGGPSPPVRQPCSGEDGWLPATNYQRRIS